MAGKRHKIYFYNLMFNGNETNSWDSYRTVIAWIAVQVLIAASAGQFGFIILVIGFLFILVDRHKLRLIYNWQKRSLFFG